MLYHFKFTLNINDLFYSSMKYSYNSFFRILFNLIFTLLFVVFFVYTIINNIFNDLTMLYKILVIFCILLFPIIEPLVIYIKIMIRLQKNKETETELEFYEDKYIVKKDSKTADIEYKYIYNIANYKKLVILFYNTIQGQLIPVRAFNNNKNDFYKFILSKIKHNDNK